MADTAEYANSVIALGDLKEALLYFDYVVSLDTMGFLCNLSLKDMFERRIKDDLSEDEMHENVQLFGEHGERIIELAPPTLLKEALFNRAVSHLKSGLHKYAGKVCLPKREFEELLNDLRRKGVSDGAIAVPKLEQLRQLFSVTVKVFEMENMVVDCPNVLIHRHSKNTARASLLLRNLPLVNTENIKFSQIMEFRKDKRNINKMRQFRLFAYNNYQDKHKTFIEDDISRKLEEYHDAVKSFGLQTRNKNLTFFLKSKSVMFAGAASLYSLISGAPDAFVTTGGLAALGWKCANFAIELSNQKADFLNLANEYPVSYIADIKEKLEPKA